MPKQKEQMLLENDIIEKLEKSGWEFVKADNLNRESFEEPLLVDDLINSIKRINKDVELTSADINKVLNELKSKISGAETAKKILNHIKEGVPVKLEKEERLKYVRLIDYKNLANNELIVSRQVVYKSKENIRTDIVLYINGLPLVLIECKDPTNPSTSWYEAYKQIKKYEKAVPELFKYVQFGVAAEEKVRYFGTVPWENDTLTHIWKEEGKNEIDSIIEMLSPEKLLDIVKHFNFIRSEKSKTTRIIARYMQYRAANKIYNRVISRLKGEHEKDSGLIWHWQGSGKTLTMIFAAHKLYLDEITENPSIFFILDRIELQQQLFQEISALDLEINPEKVESIKHLKKILIHDQGKGKRGFIVTLIHKFKPGELEKLNDSLKSIKENKTIKNRKNVISFIDESHRTQYGTMAAQMRDILKNGFFFGFTGTPISKKGRDSFEVFAYPEDEDLYLDSYFIKDSIEDGFTLPFIFQTRTDEQLINKRSLEAFLEQEEIEEIPEKIKTKVGEKVSNIRVAMENPKRIEKIAEDIIDHFKENVEGKYKAMVVTASRKACVRYKKELNKHLPSDWSEIVMSYESGKDPKLISNYEKELEKIYKTKDTGEINREIVEKFKTQKTPKILIVTDMLLTGFDAPILQTMYLDKALKGHRLLQALSRTNRPLPEREKTAGLIIDYVGLLRKLNKALKFYSKLQRKDMSYSVKSMDDFEKEFVKNMKEIKKMVGDVEIKFDDREYFYKIITRLVINKKEKDFLEKYKELRRNYELLGPKKVKLEHSEYFKFLTALYTIFRKTRAEDEDKKQIEEYYKIVVDAIYDSSEIKHLNKEFPKIKLDKKYVEKIENNLKTTEARVFNRLTTIRYVLKDRPKTPVYQSISQRADNLMKRWSNRKVEIDYVYKNLKDIFDELETIDDERNKLGISDAEYDILTELRKEFKNKKNLEKKVKKFYKKIKPELFQGWEFKKTAKSKVGKQIRLFLIELNNLSKKERDDISENVLKILKEY